MLGESGGELVFGCVGHLVERHAAGTGIHAHHIEGFLDGNGVDVDEEVVAEIEVFELESGTFRNLAVKVVLADVVSDFGSDIGKHRNHALAAQRQQRNDLVVVAGIHVETVAAERRY